MDDDMKAQLEALSETLAMVRFEWEVLPGIERQVWEMYMRQHVAGMQAVVAHLLEEAPLRIPVPVERAEHMPYLRWFFVEPGQLATGVPALEE